MKVLGLPGVQQQQGLLGFLNNSCKGEGLEVLGIPIGAKPGGSPDSVLILGGIERPSRLQASSYGQGTGGSWGPLYTNPSLGSYLVAYQKWDLQAAGEILIHRLLDMIPFLCPVEIQGAAK